MDLSTWIIEYTIDFLPFYIFLALTSLVLVFSKKWRVLRIHLLLIVILFLGMWISVWSSGGEVLLPIVFLLMITSLFSIISLLQRLRSDKSK